MAKFKLRPDEETFESEKNLLKFLAAYVMTVIMISMLTLGVVTLIKHNQHHEKPQNSVYEYAEPSFQYER